MKSSQRGFSVVEIILTVVISSLIGVAGYMVYKNQDKKTANSTSATVQPTKNETLDPYKDWQSFCDTRAKSCFKYPVGWNLAYGASINTQLNSPDAKLEKFSDSDQKYPTGQYAVHLYLSDADSAYGTSFRFNFTTTSIEAVTGSPDLKVVGGYDPTTNIASYSIVDTAIIEKYGLVVGKTSENIMNLTYSNSPTSSSFAFYANDASISGEGTVKNVTDWFASDYAKQSLLILKSYKAQ